MSKRDKLLQNIEAIECVLSENLNPEKLKLYSGFGDLKCILLDPNTPETFSNSEKELIPHIKELHEVLKKYSNTEQQYKQYLDSLKTSVLTSFYTPAAIIDSIDNVFQNHNLHFDNLLDPSAGNGAFLKIKANNYTAVEKEVLTGKILKAQNPTKNIQISGFEEISRSHENTFDIVTSNIPFGDYKVFDPYLYNSKTPERKHACSAIHNYFFAKGLDQLREGGILAFITSTGVMDAQSNDNFRQYLLNNSHLISAVRLPENAFQEAGTKVQSDLIILQKNSNRTSELTNHERLFIQSTKDENEIRMSAYFKENSSAIIHTHSKIDKDLYGKPGYRYTHENGVAGIAVDIRKTIAADILKNLNESLFLSHSTIINEPIKSTKKQEQSKPIQLSLFDNFNDYVQERKEPVRQTKARKNIKPTQASLFDDVDFNQEEKISTEKVQNKPSKFEFKDGYAKEGSYVLSEDKELIGVANNDNTATTIIVDNPELIKSYIELRRSYFELKLVESKFQKEFPDFREKLNSDYDSFREKYGTLTENNYISDPAFIELQGLEIFKDGEFQKADIFREPVDFIEEKEEYPLEEALSKSRNLYNSVNLEYISELSNLSTDEVVSKLEGDKIFFNPQNGNYETPDVYLSGNVFKKLYFATEAFEASGRSNRQILNSIVALEGVIPEKIQFEDIGIQLGERWIPDNIYSSFVSDAFKSDVDVQYNSALDEHMTDGSYTFYSNEKYGVKSHNRNYTAYDVMKFAFRNNMPDMTLKVERDGQEITIPDTEGIQKMNASIDMIRKEFVEWSMALPNEKKEFLENLYNNKFNCFVKPKYDGSFQTFPGLSRESLGIKDLYDSQKDTTLMIKNQNGGLVDHEVGGGKTMIMCTASYELKRLGLANKPCIIGLKANISQIAETYRLAYPEAKILYASEKDFAKKERENFLKKIQNNNWDCVIMSHEQFKAIPQSLEIQKSIIQKELEKIESVIDGAKTKKDEKILLKKKENLSARLNNLIYTINQNKGETIDFKTMGIDHLFIDESHQFKNLMFQTRHNRVAGLGNSNGSDRALNLLFALRTIQEKNNRDFGATFLSGTPISNSLTELYNIFTYLCPRALQEQGIESFDAWVNTYALKSKEFEFNVTNDIILKERFRHFIKVPELAMFYNQIADYRSAEMIGIDRPEKNEILIATEQTPQQQDMFLRLKEFAKTGDGTLIYREALSKSEEVAKMLIATNTAKKASLDMQLISPSLFEDEPGNKASIAADKIFEYYIKYNSTKGTQFVFCDLGTYKPGTDFNVYSKIKEKLIEKGIPDKEIQFIQQHNTDNKRQELFNNTNNGNVRILFGSTQMLGTGVNAQDRCVAIHHMDIPWTPKDLEQRNGRGARKGNWVAKEHCANKVDTIIYATKGTLDTYKFNLLKNKALFISQLKSDNLCVRTIDEGGMDKNSGMGFAEYIAVLSGNTDLLEKTKLEKIILQLKSEETSFNKNIREKENTISKLTTEKEKNNNIISLFKEDFKNFIETPHIVSIEGKRLTDPAQIGDALNMIIDKQNQDTWNYQKIGSFGSFNIVMKAEALHIENGNTSYQNKVFIEGNLKYSHNHGIVARTPKIAGEYHINALNRIPGLIENYHKKNEEIDSKIKTLVSLNLKWGKKDELDSYVTKFNELTKRIEKSINQTSREEKQNVSNENNVKMKR